MTGNRMSADQLITWAKIIVALSGLGGFLVWGINIYNTGVEIPHRLALLEQNDKTAKDRMALSERMQLDMIWYLEFLVRKECQRTDAVTKTAIRDGGGVNCDLPGIKIPR